MSGANRTGPKGRKNPTAIIRKDVMARAELDKMNVSPIALLMEIYTLARDGYLKGRGITEKGDNGSAYLAVAGKAAADMARYAYPTMASVNVKTESDIDKSEMAIDVAEARKALLNDPFAQEAITESAALAAKGESNEGTWTLLPQGKKNE